MTHCPSHQSQSSSCCSVQTHPLAHPCRRPQWSRSTTSVNQAAAQLRRRTQLIVPQAQAGGWNIPQRHGARSHCSPCPRRWWLWAPPGTEPRLSHSLGSVPHLPTGPQPEAPVLYSHTWPQALSSKRTNSNPSPWLHNGWECRNNTSIFSLSWKPGIQDLQPALY